jgi:twitching motility protein PilJ
MSRELKAILDYDAARLEIIRLGDEISNSTLAQSSLADGVAKNIDSILTITERTRNGTTQTANAVHELLVLAEELKSAVARFRIA